MSSKIFKGFLKHQRCGTDDEDFWIKAKAIYIEQRSIFFKIIEFQYWHVPILEWIHISRRVAWVFAEVLVILLAMNLSMKFQQFNKRLSRTRHQTMWSSYWKEMYQHYVVLCNLTEKANEFVSPILLGVTLVNFFFLCERLYRQYA